MFKKVGFIGIGEMGYPMALNLVKAGYEVTAFDAARQPLEELEAQGGKIANSIADLAKFSEIVILMVRTTEQAEQVILGENGVIPNAHSGTIVIVMSTVLPTAIQEMSSQANKKNIALLDCPVSGARPKAEAGTLTIMAGGPEEAFKLAKPLLEVIGENIFYLGGSGFGEASKLINNLLLLVHMNAAYEALSLAKKVGIDFTELCQLIKVSTGGSWIIENWELVASWKDNYKEGGTLDLIYKDISMTLALAEELKVPLHLSALAKQLGRY